MPAGERGGLKAAFSNFSKTTAENEAELKLLGRTIPSTEPPAAAAATDSYQVAIRQPSTGLIPRPLLQREAVRQLSFRCPVSLAGELKRKAAFNQLEQQQIMIEGIKRVLSELQEPPGDWEAGTVTHAGYSSEISICLVNYFDK
jgi:hypothetical protein